MPVTITFHTFKEKQPKHQDSVIRLCKTSSFDMEGFNPREVTVEYMWEEIDETGSATGIDCCYHEGDKQENGYRLVVSDDNGEVFEDDSLWISVDEYWECFD